MSRPISLTRRLTLLFSIVATVVFLAFGWIIERSINEHFAMEDIKELKVIAQAVEHSLSRLQTHQEQTRTLQRLNDILVGHHGPQLYIQDAAGNEFYRSTGADLSRILSLNLNVHANDGIQQWHDGQHSYRVLTQKITLKNSHTYTVVIAVAIDFHLHFINEFHNTLWLMIVVAIVIMALMSWIAVRQGHRPLHNIVQQISQTQAGELNARLDLSMVPAELTELALSFNALLQRMEESFKRLADFSADIAHELRTPVTNLMTQTQVALSQARDAQAYQEILYSNIEEYDRMAQMIGDMLFLAKTDNRQNRHKTEEIDLTYEVANLFDYYEAWAEEHAVTLSLSGHAHTQGDPLLLRRALSNLLSNAIRHTPQHHTVNIQLSQTDHHAIIMVKNPGLKVAAEHLSKIFDRFYRVDPSRQRHNGGNSEGAGLGLAITQAIVKSHGGEISATSDDQQTQFIIKLPNT